MAKATTGRDASGKVKPAVPAAPAGKKANSAKGGAKKPVSGKMAAKAKAGVVTKQAALVKAVAAKKIAAKGKTLVATRNSVPGKAVGAKKTVVPLPKVAVSKVAVPKIAGRTLDAAKTVAVTQAKPRRLSTRTAVPSPATRRGHPPAAVRKTPVVPPARPLGRQGPQVFTVSHLDEADFKADGLRAYSLYRDLGIAAATGGLCQAHVIRMIPPCTDAVRKRHVHQTALQLIYVLKGWMKNAFEGHGEQMMSTGSCWLQPSGIEHTVLDYSADCEVLEIIVPADFTTKEVV